MMRRRGIEVLEPMLLDPDSSAGWARPWALPPQARSSPASPCGFANAPKCMRQTYRWPGRRWSARALCGLCWPTSCSAPASGWRCTSDAERLEKPGCSPRVSLRKNPSQPKGLWDKPPRPSLVAFRRFLSCCGGHNALHCVRPRASNSTKTAGALNHECHPAAPANQWQAPFDGPHGGCYDF